jgi:hypothetical protein
MKINYVYETDLIFTLYDICMCYEQTASTFGVTRNTS